MCALVCFFYLRRIFSIGKFKPLYNTPDMSSRSEVTNADWTAGNACYERRFLFG